MSRNQRKWVGTLKTQPQDPDLVLSRLTQWTRDPQQRFSTLDGPEPDNLTTASAWIGRIPDNAIAREAFIYRDRTTNLWIQAVAWPLVPCSEVNRWADVQRSMGAVATWYNGNAKPYRRRKTYAERELGKIDSQELTYVDLLHEKNMFNFNGIDLVRLIPTAEPRSIDIDIMKQMIAKNPSGKKKYARLPPGQRQRLATKPVETPLGIFASVNAAAKAHGFSASKMSVVIAQNLGNGYQFISQADYANVIANVNKQDNKMLS